MIIIYQKKVEKRLKKKQRKYFYLSNSAVVLRWNIDLSSLITEESISFPLENSILPKWRIAATTLNIASWIYKKSFEFNKFMQEK